MEVVGIELQKLLYESKEQKVYFRVEIEGRSI